VKRSLFHGLSGLVVLALIIATLQILFDVPVAPFLVPGNGKAGETLVAVYDDGVQRAVCNLSYTAYPSLIVQRGIPAEFILNAKAKNIDECNEYLSFPDFGIKNFRLIPGTNVIRFMPEESGVFNFNCHLNAMKSTITVVESLGFNNVQPPTAAQSKKTSAPEPDASSEASHHRPLQQNETPAQAPVFEKPDSGVTGIGGWLEKQLTPSSGAEGVHAIRSWTGWIFDRDCVGMSPVRHTKACNLMGGCFDSGLGIFEYVQGKEYDTYTAIDTFLCFDGASKELAAAFLKALPAEWKNNITVTVSGYAVNNIPASQDETLVPETDLSRVDHYLNGIHVTSISPAFIEGVSSNPMPEPNVVFTQP
jgi:hypothetical protein